MRLEDARKLPKYAKVRCGERVYDFGYVGQTGKLILYEEGERNMQDSCAVAPEFVEALP
jgi:hypothetical protein